MLPLNLFRRESNDKKLVGFEEMSARLLRESSETVETLKARSAGASRRLPAVTLENPKPHYFYMSFATS